MFLLLKPKVKWTSVAQQPGLRQVRPRSCSWCKILTSQDQVLLILPHLTVVHLGWIRQSAVALTGREACHGWSCKQGGLRVEIWFGQSHSWLSGACHGIYTWWIWADEEMMSLGAPWSALPAYVVSPQANETPAWLQNLLLDTNLHDHLHLSDGWHCRQYKLGVTDTSAVVICWSFWVLHDLWWGISSRFDFLPHQGH